MNSTDRTAPNVSDAFSESCSLEEAASRDCGARGGRRDSLGGAAAPPEPSRSKDVLGLFNLLVKIVCVEDICVLIAFCCVLRGLRS